MTYCKMGKDNMPKYSEFVNTKELRIARLIKGISCEQMAELLEKKSRTSYDNIEKGEVEPRISDINKIAEILGKPATVFFNIKVQES